MRTSPPLSAPLFRSQGQAALLSAILLGEEPVGLTDLAARAGVPRSSAYREVSRLVDAGLLRVATVGREWQVSANPASPLTDPVRRILAVAYGPAVLLTEQLSAIEGVETAVIFGSFAARAAGVTGPAPQDIDLLVVGEVSVLDVYAVTRSVSEAVGRTVNPTILSSTEWAAAREQGSVFVRDVTANPVIPLIGAL